MTGQTLTQEQRASRARERMLEKAKEYRTSTYSKRFVAPLYQRMVRAESAALPDGEVVAIVGCEEGLVFRRVGQCVCVTCGKVGPWKGGVDRYSGFHTGHFLASRCNSILFEDENVAPQCAHCNVFRDGEQQLFRKWMLAVRGIEVVERLERLKTSVVKFDLPQLVDMRIEFSARLKAAEQLLIELRLFEPPKPLVQRTMFT